MFTEMGATIPTYISFGIQLVGVIAIFFFDNERLKESAEEKRTEEKNTPSAEDVYKRQVIDYEKAEEMIMNEDGALVKYIDRFVGELDKNCLLYTSSVMYCIGKMWR